MSVKTSRAFNDLVDTILKIPIVLTITSSSIYLGITIVIIITLIAMFVYRESEELLQKGLRVMFWSGLVVTGLLILKDRNAQINHDNANTSKATDDVFDNRLLLTRANTTTDYSNTQLATTEQLMAAANRRGLVLMQQPSLQSPMPTPVNV